MSIHESLLRSRLKEARLHQNLTEEEVAKKLGKASNAFVSRIENGPQKLTIETINQLCKIYQIEPLSLFHEAKTTYPDKPTNFFRQIAFRADEETLSPAGKDNINKILPRLRKLGRVMRDLKEPPLCLKDFYSGDVPSESSNPQAIRKIGKKVAVTLREHCNLGKAPIADLQNFIWHYVKIPVCGIDFDKSCWGIYSKDNFGNPLILYSTSHRFQQRNIFTIAHELGHHFFHPNEEQIDCDHSSNEQLKETLANAFAQELLVPTATLNEYYEENGLNFVTLEPKHIVELCEYFKVSYQMMCLVLYYQTKINKDNYELLIEKGKKEKLFELNYFRENYISQRGIEYYLQQAVAKALRKKVINKLVASEILDITTKEVEKII